MRVESEEFNSRLLSPPLIPEEEENSLSRRIWTESKKMWVVAGPAIITRFANMGLLVITQAFVGHIGSLELAAYALSLTVVYRFAMSILLGLSSALETLCGQAYGAKQHHMLGIYLQRSWVILSTSFVLLLPLFIFTAPILELLGQDKTISNISGTICLWYIPVIFGDILGYTLQLYLQSQSKNIIIAYLAVFSIPFHIFLSWLLVIHLSLGIPGAMGALIISMWIPVIGEYFYITCGGCPDTWDGFSLGTFVDLYPLVKLSISSGAMLCLELWYDSILILLTGNMTNAEVQLDALSICLNIAVWDFMISLGLLAAAGVRVANELGAGDPKAVKFAIVHVVSISSLIGTVLFILFLVFGGNLAYVFTDNTAVIEAVADLSPFLAFTILLQSVQPVLSGVAIGAGWQKLVAYVNITCYYLVGIPLGVTLGYLIGYQVKGIWIGMIIGTLIQTLVLSYITWRMDWDKQVALARTRVNKWLLPESSE